MIYLHQLSELRRVLLNQSFHDSLMCSVHVNVLSHWYPFVFNTFIPQTIYSSAFSTSGFSRSIVTPGVISGGSVAIRKSVSYFYQLQISVTSNRELTAYGNNQYKHSPKDTFNCLHMSFLHHFPQHKLPLFRMHQISPSKLCLLFLLGGIHTPYVRSCHRGSSS